MTSSYGPAKIVEEAHPTRIVETSGVVELDRHNVKSMPAYEYSTIVRVDARPETFVQKGSVIAAVACPVAVELQAIYLWRRLNKKMGSRLYIESEIEDLCLRLQSLGFTEQEFRQLRRTRRPLESIDLRAPWSGIVVDLPQPGDEIHSGEAFFSIAWRKVTRVTVPLADAPEVRERVKFGGNGKAFIAEVSGVKKYDETADVEIGVMDWSDEVPMGVPVWIKYRVHRPPSRQLRMVGMRQLDLSDWKHASPPRGQALRKLLRDQNRHDDAAKLEPAPRRDEKPAAKVASSTPAQRTPPPLAAEARDGIRRTSIAMTTASRERFGIQNYVVSETQFTPKARFQAHVKVMGAHAALMTLTAPIGGKVTWQADVTDRALPTGEPYCRIEGEEVRAVHNRFLRAISGRRTAEAQRARRALMRLGMTSNDIYDLERGIYPKGVLALRAPAPCMIGTMDVLSGQVVAKDAALAHAHSLQWTALCLDLDDDTRAEFGNVVDVYLPDPDTGHVSSTPARGLSLVDVSRKRDRVQCRIEFPEPPASLLGKKEVQIFIAAPAKRRTVIAVPEDCVTTVFRTREVLIDEGFKVTPQKVRVGRQYDGQIEILGGLSAGHRIVRNLDALAMRSKRLTAVLLGIWQADSLYWEFGLDE